jgi:hypothetical protein
VVSCVLLALRAFLEMRRQRSKTKKGTMINGLIGTVCCPGGFNADGVCW